MHAKRQAAEREGPLTVLPVAMDELRIAISRLPESRRAAAASQATRLLDEFRESITPALSPEGTR
ncbi:hypothetical protein GCM10010253_43220 [Streptomyces badius]|uniref:Uncharacterized protein n=1 Tax=Streptomyces badius TaxID=1941 RepID=A0ABQ2TDV1_STRBA|nr:hypothetical protein GCM10010253_43220 [Streptomyces badius]